MRVVIAPDSFKGSLSAERVAEALAVGWGRERPTDDVRTVPLADGGEGTCAVLAAAHPDALSCPVTVTGPDGRPVRAAWLLLPDGTAVVELAAASGLPLMARPDALAATTRGTGELIAAALAHPDTRRLLVALGGSASTDGGAGALQALGVRLRDADGRDLPPGGGHLRRLAEVDLAGLPPLPPDGAACLVDVTAPLLGPSGAASQFGPQKGATPDQVGQLDTGLRRLAEVLGASPDRPGAGAAGGTGYGLAAAWGATLVPGAPTVADAAGLPAALSAADLVVTGEGRFDAQSGQGKIVGYVLRAAADHGVDAHLVAGQVAARLPVPVVESVDLSVLAGSTEAAIGRAGHWLTEAGRRLAGQVRWPLDATPAR
ncbi:glycerate kinase [Micromonospora nigra]|uniref:Glycerate kinase n=1 Tax=Micromonospora nigra TaxID=145857 RepID=A0A1C6SYU3_9ACTN|nr:glycerate kinase [Micromonospora nigra]SCL34746.1 glycerate kinase [Micromonospora nigra]